MDRASNSTATPTPRGTALQVLAVFLQLGLSSFGGPVAHLGYFRAEFVARRRWLDDASYSDLVALCQFLPGPTSSQVGFAIGLQRAGWAGALAAWIGFTLPSALLLIAFAHGIVHVGTLAASGAIHGLKVVAVAVVAQAVWSMGRSLCPDRIRVAIALGACLVALALPSTLAQVGAMLAAGIAGWLAVPVPPPPSGTHGGSGISRRAGVASLAAFAVLLVGLPIVAAWAASPTWRLVDGFYRAGALVFGGGHVVLPLLQAAVVPAGFASDAQFLAGYGAAQAVPGPLFSFAAYLGAVMQWPLAGWHGALLLLAVVFLPGLLLVVAALPFWDALRHHGGVRRALAGINAGVVGLLLAALYDPVWTGAIHRPVDALIALAGLGLLVSGRVSPVVVVVLGAAAGWLVA